MGRCLNHEMTLDRIREKARLTEDELNELRAWKVVQEKKLALAEQAKDEFEKMMKQLKQVLQDKEKEICDAKDWLRQAKEEAVREYHDSNALLAELGGSFAEDFEDALRQVKTSFPDLDLSHINININTQDQTSFQPVHFKSTDELFVDDTLANDPHGDGGDVVDGQVNQDADQARHPEDLTIEEKNETPTQIMQFFLFSFFGGL